MKNKFKILNLNYLTLFSFSLLLYAFPGEASFQAPSEWNCQLSDQYSSSQKYECTHPTSRKKFQIYSLIGTRLETAKAQGYLSAQEFIHGTYAGLNTTIERTLSSGGGATEAFTRSIYNCYSQRVRQSLHPEIKAMAQSFSHGIAEKRGTSSQHYNDALTMLASYEIANVVTGFKQILSDSTLEGLAELAGACGLTRPLFSIASLIDSLSPLEGLKMGCTGFAIPADYTKEKSMIHGRNLDGGFVEFFNQHPSLYYVAETGKYKFISSAPAASLIAGSVSGMNEKGIAVSLHQLSTKNYQSSQSGSGGSTAPYIQHLVLSEASSIDEAFEIVRKSKRYGAWTLFVSDAKTNETASIEFTGDRAELARRFQNRPMSQTNHYLGRNMQDQYFTYSLAKQIESETRMQTVDQFFAANSRISLQDGIELLTGHSDPWSPVVSFGRTTTKTYTLMTTLAMPEANQFWFTIGDRWPANQGNYVGFEMDWNSNNVQLIESRQARNFKNKPSWLKSLTKFIEAYVATLTQNCELTINKLDEAVLLAEKDNVFEKNYLFMKARSLEYLGRTNESMPLWQRLLVDVETTPNETSYAMRVRLHWLNAANETGLRRGNEARFSQVYSNTLHNLNELEQRYPKHGEIKKFHDDLSKIWSRRTPKWATPEFITIE